MKSSVMMLVVLFVNCFLALSHALLEAPADGFLKREFSLNKPYSGNGMTMPYWDFRDFVMISNSFIRLTQDTQGQQGSIWAKKPCYMHDWEMHVQYKVHGSGRSLAADGMAFWYTRTKMVPGSVFGSKDQFEGLGVFLDTYKNGNQPVAFPQVSAMIGNGTLKYDHANDGKDNSIGNCLTSFRNKQYDTYMKIRYSRETLTVSFDNSDMGEWKDCIHVTGVKLPTNYFFGFSAATGDLADNHELISIKLYELNVARTPEEEKEDWSLASPGLMLRSPIDNREDGGEGAYRNTPMSGLKLFGIILCVLLGVAVCACVAYLIIQKRNESNRKRFY